MKTNRNINRIGAIIAIALGIMFCVLKGGVISIALSIIGVTAIIMGVVDFAGKRTSPGIVKVVIGVCVIVFGWMFVDIALYIVAAILLIQGLKTIVEAIKNKADNNSAQNVIAIIRPVACVVAGGCLLFNKNEMIDGVFVVVGVLLLIEGVLALTDSRR